MEVAERVLLVVDNFRVGGLERLALDQLYALQELGISAEAHYRQVEVTHNLPNFLSLEASRISEKGLKIVGLPRSDLGQLRQFIRLFRENEFTLVINHSVGSAVLLRVAVFVSRKSTVIKTFIHQLPTLSAPVQRAKRFIYCLFSDELYGYSLAVVRDWNKRITQTILPKIIKKKLTIKLLRNGIYLDRMPSLKIHSSDLPPKGRLIFIGRNVGWKNLNKVFTLLRNKRLNDYRALVVVPMLSEDLQHAIQTEFINRVDVEIGKTIEQIDFYKGDVNIYPVDYGPNANFVESISLNCLEMACVGIPSLVARRGSDTWPELIDLGIVREVDWNDEEEIISNLLDLPNNFPLEHKIGQARKIISIENNLKNIFLEQDV